MLVAPMVRYWRFLHPEHGVICQLCAFVLAYNGSPPEPVKVESPAWYRCERCGQVGPALEEWPRGSRKPKAPYPTL